jgi:acetyltransferase-like isoleucine patch superfamily enzyme
MIKNLLKGKYLSSSELSTINFKKIGKNVLIDSSVIIPNTNRVEIGDNVRIDSHCILSSGKNGNIIIKNNVHIAPFNLIYCADNHKVLFENHSGLAAGCKLYGRTDNYDGRFLLNPTHNDEDIELKKGDIILEKFATLGCDTVLFPGSVIPIGTVIGSKSLYTAKFKLRAWAIYAGIPLNFINHRNKHVEILSQKYI